MRTTRPSPIRSLALVVVSVLPLAGVVPAAGAQAPVAVADVMVPEPGGNGTNIATFTIRLVDTTRTLYLQVSTAVPTGVPAATPASAGGGCGGHVDYLPLTAVGVTLSPSNRQQTVTVPLCGDAFDEADERFLLRLVQSNGQSINDNEAIGTITDDDPTPTLRINDVQLTEPQAGGMTTATFNISLSAASGRDVSFSWQTAPAQAGLPATGGVCGTPGSDFQPVALTPVTIPAYSPATNVSVTVCGDGVYEGNEALRVELSALSPTAAFSDNAGVLSIMDREQPPTIAIAPTVNFGPAVPPSPLMNVAVFTISLAGPPTERPVTVDYATVNGTATGSNSCLDVNLGGVVRRAGDYISKSATGVTITAPATTVSVSYCKLRNISGRTFSLQLTNVRNASPATVSRAATLP